MSHGSKTPFNPANSPSERFFSGIGIARGSRVLDIGCGNGDLSRLLARIVGPEGEVVGIDSSEPALAMARGVDNLPGMAPIEYRTANLSADLPDMGTFDAITARRVLMYLPDATATLSRLLALARPGAMLAFQEHSRANLPFAAGPLPLHRQLYDWMWNTIVAERGDVKLALGLVERLRALGLSIIEARGETILMQPGEPSFLPVLTRMMLPRLIEGGVATAEEVQLETLAERIEQERQSVGGTIMWDQAFLVAARVAG